MTIPVKESEVTESKQKKVVRPPHLYKKGQSGNPAGRPKGSGLSITTEIKRELDKIPQGQKATNLQLLIKKILKLAIEEDDKVMIKNIWNYVDGLPKQSTEVTLRAKPIPILGDVKDIVDNVHKDQSNIEAGEIIEED